MLGWNKLRPLLEPAVVAAQAARKAQERQVLVESRKRVVNVAYHRYKRTILPATWAYHPGAYTVYEFEPFAKIIDDPEETQYKEDDFASAVKELPRLLDNWKFEKIRQLISLLPRHGSDGDSRDLKPAICQEDLNSEVLNLAISVFTCLGSVHSPNAGGRCLIGWDGAGIHLKCGALRKFWDRRLHFTRRGFDAARELVKLANLDPNTALAREMDKVDARFVCASCPQIRFKGFQGRQALLWRECVSLARSTHY